MCEPNVLNRLTEEWNDLKEIIVYGYGRVAVRNIGKLWEDFSIGGIIDNNSELQGVNYKGIPIRTFEQSKEQIRNKKIVVATSSLAYASISKGLKNAGLKEFQDFCRLEDFMPEWYWKNKNEVCLSQIFSSVTSRCTFNCKYCNMLMPYYTKDNHYDYTAEDILADFDALFQRVDYLTSYFVIGGEPLLNKELGRILETVFDKYGSKIGYMQIITNGSVIPSGELMRVIKKCNIHVRISDYTHVLPYKKKLQQVKNTLSKNGIPYSISIYETWMDLGFPEKVEPIGETKEAEKKHMLLCSPGCHIMSDKKVFYCGLIFSAEKCGLYHLQQEDYVDLEKKKDGLEAKEEILRYCLGDVKNEAISICNVCRGSGSDNRHIVGVAEQCRKRQN